LKIDFFLQTNMSKFEKHSQLPHIDVLCVGHASHDIILQLAHHPRADEKVFAETRLECGGGPASNAAVTVARLGGQSAFAGYLGRDVYGEQHFKELQGEAINTELVQRGNNPTPLSIILVKPNGARTVINHKSLTPPLGEDSLVLPDWQPKVILFDGHEPLISQKLMEFAKAEGIPTVLDAGSVHQGTRQLAPQVDYLAASLKFAGEFSGENIPENALKILAPLTPTIIITLGEKGLIWKNKQDSGKLPAVSVRAVDTTGAGDVFHGAFALGIAQGRKFRDNLIFASAAAALTCTELGARTSIPTADEVHRFLEEHQAELIPE
jgi:sulfofructose kinase